MAVTQAQINELLASLKALLDQILALRQRAETLQRDLLQAQHDYDERLGALIAEAEWLQVIMRRHQSQIAEPAAIV